MNIALSVLVIVVILWWLLARELPVLFGALVSTGALKRNKFDVLVGVVVVAAIVAGLMLPLYGHLTATYSPLPSSLLVVVVVLAFGVVLLLERFGTMPSLMVALLAMVECYRVLNVEGTTIDYKLLISWVVAPVVSALVSALLYWVNRVAFGKSHLHIIKHAGYLRYVVILGIALAAAAVGLNCGPVLVWLTGGAVYNGIGVGIVTVAFVALFVLLRRAIHKQVDANAEHYLDFSSQAVCAICYAASITLLLFSTSAVEVVGLRPTPLGVASPLYGAMVGVALVRRRAMYEGGTIGRVAVGVVATPLLSMACYYLLSSLFSDEVMANDLWNATIVVILLLLGLLVVFARYVRKQESLKQSTRKLLLSQQQQLFENQKALNDLELKAILAENQSLHGTLELKRKEIVNVALGISEQKEFLEMLAEKVRVAAKSSSSEAKDKIIAELQNDLSQRINSSSEIDEFYAQAEQLHKDFSVKLTEEFPHLTTSERRLATLLRLGFSSKYIATLMNISPKSVEISRYRLRQKLGLQKGDNLINFIKSI